MSLILDALRKLERDKQPRDPSVVLVGHVPWGGRERARWLRRTAFAAGLLAIGLGAGWLLVRPAPSTRRSPVLSPATEHGGPPPSPAASDPSAASPGVLPDSTAAPAAAPLVAPPPSRGIELPAPETASTLSAVSAPDTQRGDGASVEPTPAVPAPGVDAPSGRDRSLHLTAISERDGRPVALLNDHLVREGDSFDGVLVLRIDATEVEVEIDGKKRVIGF